jgi:hypothetical protein
MATGAVRCEDGSDIFSKGGRILSLQERAGHQDYSANYG